MNVNKLNTHFTAHYCGTLTMLIADK